MTLEEIEELEEQIESIGRGTDGRLQVVTASEVEPEDVSWLWKPWIPLGCQTILAGDPDEAKTFLSLEIAARVSSGRPLPGEDGEREPTDIIFFAAEDGKGELRRRLDKQDGDPTRVHFVTGSTNADGQPTTPDLTDPDLLEEVEELIERTGARLLIADPITSFLPDVDEFREGDVRSATAPLDALAERTDTALLFIKHLRKASADQALYKVAGSIAFTAAPRSVLLAGHDPKEAESRAVAQIKNNYHQKPEPIGYRFDATGRLRLETQTTLTTADLLREDEKAGAKRKREEAENFLRGALDGDPRPAEDVRSEAKALGISERTLRRARQSLGVQTERRGGIGDDGTWYWSLKRKPGEEG